MYLSLVLLFLREMMVCVCVSNSVLLWRLLRKSITVVIIMFSLHYALVAFGLFRRKLENLI